MNVPGVWNIGRYSDGAVPTHLRDPIYITDKQLLLLVVTLSISTQSVLSVKRGTRSFRAEGFACDHFIRTVSSLGIDRRREMLSIGHVLTACTGCTSATSANNTGKTNILGFGNVAILLVENTSTRSALPPMQAMRQLLSVPRTRVRNVAAKRKPPLCQSVFDVPKCTAVNANRRR